jgi:hypothetical protein
MLGVLLAANRSGGSEITGAVCGPTAGFLLGLLGRDEPTIHVVSTRRISGRKGYRFHLTTRLPARDVVELNGLRVTDPIRTFLDLCDVFPHLSVYMLKRGLRLGLFTRQDVHERIEEESRQGRAGLCAAREALERTDPTAGKARSAREDHYFELLVEMGYPPPERNYKIKGPLGIEWEVDLYYPHRSKGFEISPYDTHMDPVVNTRDGKKVLDLSAAGIQIVTITDGISDAEFKMQARRILGPPEDFPRLEKPR